MLVDNNFWLTLPRPFFVLAPMADVTDAAFRRIIVKYGKPDVLWTEFVSADGLCHPLGRKRLLKDLIFTEAERPIVAQLFSSQPEKMFQASQLIQSLGFDGLDINMGCPDKTVEKQGAGAALIRNPARAVEIIKVAKSGAPGLPISVKTRLGYHRSELEEWLPILLGAEPALITIHARTRKEMSKVPARWEEVTRAVAIRNQVGSQTLIVGNGDVANLVEAQALANETGADGVMLGRAIFGNPWLFANRDESPPSLGEKLRVLVEHTKLFEKLFSEIKSFAVMKKHYQAYVQDFAGAHDLRAKLMEAQTATEVEQIIEGFLKYGLE